MGCQERKESGPRRLPGEGGQRRARAWQRAGEAAGCHFGKTRGGGRRQGRQAARLRRMGEQRLPENQARLPCKLASLVWQAAPSPPPPPPTPPSFPLSFPPSLQPSFRPSFRHRGHASRDPAKGASPFNCRYTVSPAALPCGAEAETQLS